MFSRPIVVTDYHHGSLLYSFILLFEKRFGGSVFQPIGYDWHAHGFWKVFDQPDTVAQYLDTIRGTPLENSDSVYLCPDAGFTCKGITLNGFYQLPVDIVIASIPAHVEPFQRLCESHPNKPKLIFQIGNAWSVEAGLAPNIMASAIINNVPEHIHYILYHQEFDLSVFHPDFSYPSQNIYSFVNCFTVEGLASHWTCYEADWQLFKAVETLMPEWAFKSIGAICRDGNAGTPEELAGRMRESRFIWHTKFGGDGYGHIIYNSAAVARPMIVKMEYYQDKLGKELMIDGETCLVIDGLSPEEVRNKIHHYSDGQRYANLCKNVYENFRAKVDFDRESQALHHFINGLK